MNNLLLLLDIGTGGLILIFLVLAYFGLIVFCLLDAVRATFKDSATKIVWVLVILFAPFLGSVLYLVIGRNSKI
ncbi:PLDc N-terminal domain-containing protein [Mucilaginibacter sp.]|jgi:hypothetical protein|uniref:PLDc N-terminal domain-containing protein n=1 Tax=Mucilaginibacter sp. TaxID=1882438 RepID=UPI00261E2841|nr:PLDc N-terminal domain-containing protein [Mucilaginibacter sp.]MDB5126213.1 PLDc protein [Mucilaginibacter sp.]